MNIILLILATIAPTALLLGYVYYKDIFKNDLRDLAKAFGAGMLVAIPAVIVGTYLSVFSEITFSPSMQIAFEAFVIAACTEELFKYIFFKSIAYNKQVYDPYDAIVFATCIGLGFATLENFLYIFLRGDIQESFTVAFHRGLTAVPAHAIFGIIMGYFFAKAQFNKWEEKRSLFFAFLFPMIMHGIYDYMLMSGNKLLSILFFPFLILMWVIGYKCIKQLE